MTPAERENATFALRQFIRAMRQALECEAVTLWGEMCPDCKATAACWWWARKTLEERAACSRGRTGRGLSEDEIEDLRDKLRSSPTMYLGYRTILFGLLGAIDALKAERNELKWMREGLEK